MLIKIKKRLFEIMEMSSGNDTASRVFDVSIMALIIMNVLAVVFETVQSIGSAYSNYFHNFEIFSVIVFSLEYVLRLWLCTQDSRFSGVLRGRVKYVFTPMALIDILAILPFYLPILIALDLRFIRVLRLFRLLRLFKIGRYSESLKKFALVLKLKKEELGITVFVVSILLVFTSTIMYYFEHEAQPEAFASIPRAMWWGVATLTTVGYGDVYPVTTMGKVLGALIAVLGVGMVALPAGIIASGFAEQIKIEEQQETVCPHCGKNISSAENAVKQLRGPVSEKN